MQPSIDGVAYMKIGITQNIHRSRVILGRCKIEKKGTVNIVLDVGNCHDFGNADAYTGSYSSTRIYVEEIEAPQ